MASYHFPFLEFLLKNTQSWVQLSGSRVHIPQMRLWVQSLGVTEIKQHVYTPSTWETEMGESAFLSV